MIEKIRKSLYIISMIILMAVLSIITIIMLLPYKNDNKTKVEPIRFIGTYKTALDSTVRPIDNTLVSAYKNKNITLRGHFECPILEGEKLYFFMEYLEVHIYLNNTEIYNFGTKESRPYLVNSSGMSWGYCVIPKAATQEDEWTIVLSSQYENNYYSAYRDFTQSLQIGDSGALARKVFASNGLYIVGSLVLFFLSLIILLIYMILTFQKIKIHKSMYLLVGFTAANSFWVLLDPHYSTLLFPNTIMIMQLETLCMMISSLLLLAYLGTFMQTKVKQINRILIKTMLSFDVMFLIFQLFGITDSYAVRTSFVIVMGVTAVAAAGEIWYEVRNTKKHKFQFLLVPGFVFLCFAIFESFNFALELFLPGKILFLGFFILMTAQCIHAVSFIRASIQMSVKAQNLENELTQNRISIMLSQIQPHFLYNSLLGIKQLCSNNPQKASDALEHFSYYLRSNMDSLSSIRLISFEKELNHIEDYLYLEKMRFEERLKIEWKIEYTDFFLPPLTLQPIVENAVRYGITQKEDGGTLIIESKLEDSSIIITISDNGVGFDINETKTNKRSHIGISNVSRRIESQCGGTLSISSEIGIGTNAKIILPMKEEAL